MKFVMNVEKMEHKGECHHCPMLSFNYYDNEYHCELRDKTLPPKSMEKECPLEEYNEK